MLKFNLPELFGYQISLGVIFHWVLGTEIASPVHGKGERRKGHRDPMCVGTAALP